MNHTRFLRVVPVSLVFVVVIGCSSMPKEVVELSYVTGNDLQAVYDSYDSLIHQFYENLRSQRRAYLDDVWYPRFLENWRKDGELVAIAKGEKIWSETDEKLIPTPANSDPREQLKTLNDWVSFALYAYEAKEESLVKPLNDDEKSLRSSVKDAFERLMLANATITAHLNSLRKVNEVQDQVLAALNIGDLRDKINSGLQTASEKADVALRGIRESDARLDDLINQVNSLRKSN